MVRAHFNISKKETPALRSSWCIECELAAWQQFVFSMFIYFLVGTSEVSEDVGP